jgi:hypothetical protein
MIAQCELKDQKNSVKNFKFEKTNITRRQTELMTSIRYQTRWIVRTSPVPGMEV